MREASPAPNIHFRETIRHPASGERKYIRYFDGRGHFGHVSLQLIPRPGERCATSVDAACDLPPEASTAAELAISERFDRNPQYRLPFIGFEVRLTGGTWLPRYSNPETCAIAAGMAFEEALRRAAPVIVEPYTCVSILVGLDALAWTIRALGALLGELRTTYRVTETVRLDAEVPVRLLDEVQALGLRIFNMTPLAKELQYQPVPFSGGSLPGALDDWT